MKSAFRNAYLFTVSLSRSLNPNTNPYLNLSSFSHKLPLLSTTYLSPPLLISRHRKVPGRSFSTTLSMSGGADSPSPSLDKQFEEFRSKLEESGSLREKIRAVVLEIESTTRLMHSGLLLVHQSRPVPEVLEKAKAQIGVLQGFYNRLAEITRECPGQYYRYHGDWKSETQTVVSLLTFMYWLETGNLLMHSEAEEKLGLNSLEFGLDIEDYLIGVCFMSNEMPRYVVNQVTNGDYDCPRKVLKFLTDLHAAFRMLNLRNDFLRKKFDGMKYDLRRVEEVHYDVKIRGLTGTGDSKDANQGVVEGEDYDVKIRG
uniref:Translin n=1 Tax=Salix viminalis TaxID=40686 RepID=A0A6N2L5V3_SALVM